MLRKIKQFFCRHESIFINTEISSDSLIIVKTIIECTQCNKTFHNHPHHRCCYVEHIHSEIIKEKFINEMRKAHESKI